MFTFSAHLSFPYWINVDFRHLYIHSYFQEQLLFSGTLFIFKNNYWIKAFLNLESIQKKIKTLEYDLLILVKQEHQ